MTVSKRPTTLLELSRSRLPAEQVVAMLQSDNTAQSLQAGRDIVGISKELGISARDYLRLAVDPTKGEFANTELDGYQTALMALNLPVKDNFSKGVVLEAAAETFQTFAGVRALFPEVIDDIVHWKYRQTNFENVDNMISQSRTVSGTQMLTTVIDDSAGDAYGQWGAIAEGARIPVRSIRGSQYSVPFFKFGGGYEWTYEFARRVSLDIVAPYAQRLETEIQKGQVGAVTSLLINGDSVYTAATVTSGKTLAASIGVPHVQGQINWEVLLNWLVARAQAGVPIDTVVGNWDMWFQWKRMFAKPSIAMGMPQVEVLRAAGVTTAEANPRLSFHVEFEVSSSAPAQKLIGFSKADTVEELIETGSDIEESQQAIENQKVKYVKTRNSGYRLIFGDTRDILDLSETSST
jgi:hypothetical protein